MLHRIELLHESNYIHRDIKPGNFVLGRKQSKDTVHLIDFGLAKLYCDKTTKQHMSANMQHAFVGTTQYSSTNSHLELAPSRRDDLESWFYCVVEFLNGVLPW
jgi:casein kinase 1